MRNVRNNKQKGYTLLEYCAGAAIIAGILWAALNALGGSLVGLLGAVQQWAVDRTGGVNPGN
jgi:type II secretory pathway pseudopilin PulG